MALCPLAVPSMVSPHGQRVVVTPATHLSMPRLEPSPTGFAALLVVPRDVKHVAPIDTLYYIPFNYV